MTIDEIKELIQVVSQSDIAELEVSRGENRVRIRRSQAGNASELVFPTTPVVAAPVTTAVPVFAASAAVNPAAQPTAATPSSAATDDNTVYIKSPIVGTYYESPSPGSPAFVKVGDRVSAGQVLCIIESMKLMNEIESEVTGTVIAKLIESGKPVEYGEALFAIQPA